MALKTIIVDGVEHVVILERSSNDGGLIVNYVSPDTDGVSLNKRDWFQDPSLAQTVFDEADAVKCRDKRTAAAEMVGSRVAAGK